MAVRTGDGETVAVELKSGENTLEIFVPDVGRSSFTVLYIPEKAFAVCDHQRDYARSRFNGNVLSAEWVVRCRLALEKNRKLRYNKRGQ